MAFANCSARSQADLQAVRSVTFCMENAATAGGSKAHRRGATPAAQSVASESQCTNRDILKDNSRAAFARKRGTLYLTFHSQPFIHLHRPCASQPSRSRLLARPRVVGVALRCFAASVERHSSRSNYSRRQTADDEGGGDLKPPQGADKLPTATLARSAIYPSSTSSFDTPCPFILLSSDAPLSLRVGPPVAPHVTELTLSFTRKSGSISRPPNDRALRP